MQLDKANFSTPLAVSYNERGGDGYASIVTSGLDQRAINCMNEPIANSQTGTQTLYLVKRPGPVDQQITIGGSGDVPLLICRPPVGVSDLAWVFTQNGTAMKAAKSKGK